MSSGFGGGGGGSSVVVAVWPGGAVKDGGFGVGKLEGCSTVAVPPRENAAAGRGGNGLSDEAAAAERGGSGGGCW